MIELLDRLYQKNLQNKAKIRNSHRANSLKVCSFKLLLNSKTAVAEKNNQKQEEE